jgi:hypothetical protein
LSPRAVPFLLGFLSKEQFRSIAAEGTTRLVTDFAKSAWRSLALINFKEC